MMKTIDEKEMQKTNKQTNKQTKKRQKGARETSYSETVRAK